MTLFQIENSALNIFTKKREKENIKHEDQEGIFNDKQHFVQKTERKGKTETKRALE